MLTQGKFSIYPPWILDVSFQLCRYNNRYKDFSLPIATVKPDGKNKKQIYVETQTKKMMNSEVYEYLPLAKRRWRGITDKNLQIIYHFVMLIKLSQQYI